MPQPARIALVGDHNESVTAHRAIPEALAIAAAACGRAIEPQWVDTGILANGAEDVLDGMHAMWCVPASPYESMQGALDAIRIAREQSMPFLGTCGGYQHAALEYARNVLHHTGADNAEVNADAAMPLIGPLSCALVEVDDKIQFSEGSRVRELYGVAEVTEQYHCSYGVNADYLSMFEGSDLVFSGFDQAGDPRAVELKGHPFFIGTAFQPERSALRKQTHPLITAFVRATV